MKNKIYILKYIVLDYLFCWAESWSCLLEGLISVITFNIVLPDFYCWMMDKHMKWKFKHPKYPKKQKK